MVRGTLNGLTGQATLGPLPNFPVLAFNATIIQDGTAIRLIIPFVNQVATFECQLDGGKFIPCKQDNKTCNFKYLANVKCLSLGRSGEVVFTGVASGQHTVTIRATSTATGLTATTTTQPFNVPLNAISFVLKSGGQLDL